MELSAVIQSGNCAREDCGIPSPDLTTKGRLHVLSAMRNESGRERKVLRQMRTRPIRLVRATSLGTRNTRGRAIRSKLSDRGSSPRSKPSRVGHPCNHLLLPAHRRRVHRLRRPSQWAGYRGGLRRGPRIVREGENVGVGLFRSWDIRIYDTYILLHHRSAGNTLVKGIARLIEQRHDDAGTST